MSSMLAGLLGLEGFRFAHPEWGALLWAVLALVAFLVWRERRSDDSLAALIAPSLAGRLVRRPSFVRRALRVVLVGLACAGLMAALMRPQWGARQVSATQAGAEIMIALDVSRSMLAEDVAPSRLGRAKAEILDLLRYLDGDQVGLIAFAGRASVLSPLTPDFGFLRLALENAGPHSVTLGGTRLEEPIRRAVAGFGPGGAAQRAILLITDGEDHDSFAKDAAQEAAEAGVSIIAIGFGDEAGSPIVVTDPRSGARGPIVDADGRPVHSRLDGDLLRELALVTDGAYVPAGTGVLDLEAIYEAHLARLVRGKTGRAGRIVRDEGYAWCLFAALLSLAGAVWVGALAPESPRPRPARREPRTRAPFGAGGSAALVLAGAIAVSGLVATVSPGSARAQEIAGGGEPAAPEHPNEDTRRTPRETYNAALRDLSSGRAEDAARAFREARSDAPGDPELRFEATYNLGVATVAVAEAREAEDPTEALAKLREAADWFRMAVGLRPDDEDARHNLETTLRKALVLEDMLASRNAKELDAELAALAKRQRALARDVGAIVHQLATASDASERAVVAERLRGVFRERATAEREIASDADELADRTQRERDALDEVAEEERGPEDALRAAQLDGVLHYLHRASERLGHTRRELRRKRAESAYRRASGAVSEIERARDQLREPDQVIDALQRDLTSLRSETGTLAAGRQALGAQPDAPSRVPAWITSDGLASEQRSLAGRTGELDLRLRAGLENAAARSDLPPEAQAMLEVLEQAEPLLAKAQIEQNQSGDALDGDDPSAAIEHQTRALEWLGEAREFFLDLPGLIDVAWSAERRIEAVLGQEAAAEALRELRSALAEAQDRNLGRAERIETGIDDALAALREAEVAAPPVGANPTAAAPSPQEAAERAERERQLEAAGQLMTQVFAGMEETASALAGIEGTADADSLAEPLAEARAGAKRATRFLQSLRWLFLTVVERVREAAREQTQLGDATRDALVLGATGSQGAATAERIAPLLPEQRRLAERSGELADELLEFSESQAAAPDPGPGEVAVSDQGPSPEAIRQAAELVLGASTSMSEAHDALRAEAPDGDSAVSAQAAAVEALEEALALLQPPQDPNQGEDQQDEQQQGEDGESDPNSQDQNQGSHEPEDGREEQTPQNADAARTLQRVLDREAERQRERAERARSRSRSVEKDW